MREILGIPLLQTRASAMTFNGPKTPEAALHANSKFHPWNPLRLLRTGHPVHAATEIANSGGTRTKLKRALSEFNDFSPYFFGKLLRMTRLLWIKLRHNQTAASSLRVSPSHYEKS